MTAGNINTTATLDNTQFIRELKQMTAEMKRFSAQTQRSMKSTNTGVMRLDSNAKKLRGSLEGFGRVARKVFIIGALAAATKQVVSFTLAVGRAAEKFTILSRRMAVFIHDAKAMDKVTASSLEFGTNLDQTVSVLNRFAIATKGAFDTKVMLRWVEGLQASGQLVGSTTAEMTSGLQQLGQAFTKGRLDGDELRTILEAFPLLGEELRAVMKPVMDETGKSLRDLGAEGLLTRKILVQAMEGVADATRGTAKDIKTVDKSMEKLSTQWTIWVDTVTNGGKSVRFVIDALTSSFKGWVIIINSASDAWNKLIGEFEDVSETALLEELTKVSTKLGEIQNAINNTPGFKHSIDSLKEFNALLEKQSAITSAISTKRAAASKIEAEEAVKKANARKLLAEAEAVSKNKADMAAKEKADKELAKIIKLNQQKLDAIQQFDDDARQMQIDNIQDEQTRLRANEELDIELKRRELDRLVEQYGAKKELEEDFNLWVVARKEKTEQDIAIIDARAAATKEELLEDQKGSLEKFIDKTIDMNKEMQDIAVWGAHEMSRGFADMAINGEKSFSEFASSFLKQIAQMIMQALMLKMIQSTLGGMGLGFGSFFAGDGASFNSTGLSGASTGGAISFASASKYADGSAFTNNLYRQPTKFAFGGGLGVMGEAGPEAVMPLANVNGKLGVRMEGGTGKSGNNIEIGSINIKVDGNNNQTGAEQGQAISRELVNMINSMIDGRVQDQRRVGNTLNPVAQII